MQQLSHHTLASAFAFSIFATFIIPSGFLWLTRHRREQTKWACGTSGNERRDTTACRFWAIEKYSTTLTPSEMPQRSLSIPSDFILVEDRGNSLSSQRDRVFEPYGVLDSETGNAETAMDTWWIDKPRVLGSRNPSDSDLERLRRDGFGVLVSLLCEKERAPRYGIARATALGYVYNITLAGLQSSDTG